MCIDHLWSYKNTDKQTNICFYLWVAIPILFWGLGLVHIHMIEDQFAWYLHGCDSTACFVRDIIQHY